MTSGDPTKVEYFHSEKGDDMEMGKAGGSVVQENKVDAIVDSDAQIDPVLEKKVMRKVDWRLLPVVTAIYAFSLIDRTNYGGARIAGMDEALHLDVGNRASVALMILFVGYILFELPSNILLKKFGPRIWLSTLGLCFGILTIASGLVKTWGALAAVRAFLGVFEAGLLPGCFYLMTSWYRKYEIQRRLSYFIQSTFVITSFSNALAYGLTQIADEPEVDGWKWIFIVEGAITIGIALVLFFVVVDLPSSSGNKFLSPAEKELIKQRIMTERGEFEGEKITWKVIVYTFSQWHVISISFLYLAAAAGSYTWIIFNPIILRNSMGYSLVSAYMLTVPPAVFSTITTLIVSRYADKWHIRGPVCWFGTVIGLAGVAMVGFAESPVARYAGIWVGEIGTNAYIVTCVAWGHNNIRTDGPRAVLSSIHVGSAAVGAIYSSLVFRQQDAPDYIPGLAAIIAILTAGFVVSVLTSFFLWRANKKADAGKKIIEGAVGFRYTW
ncbi:hypothetical protein A1O7_02054 [Cladophialophora yegresii CBS 114405]|uniref:Major facilitator superfamily (MFS) profile domain-containing protein n=1 Tax=Cladophialophora yegresii CBS 114405 TaxID=1182544 RepID=W9W9F1_9EURO|nr:uncharacterized protein A1O7_02054 [Cladophialophora yegresii CBS 114405]EXJ61625.1 hypothetical protein A1O7_02054 [Cladophialophora yegresii CBS 114405]